MPDQIADQPEQTPRRYQCRHIFLGGHRCGSPSLRHEEFCYYHHAARQSAEDRRRNCLDDFELPQIEDRSSVLAAIAEVLQRIANGGMHTKRAGLLLYGLQIASLNLPKAEAGQDATPVERVIAHPRLGNLAPRAIVGAPEELIEDEAEETPEEEQRAGAKEEVKQNTSRYTVAEIEEMYRVAEEPLRRSKLNPTPENRVPHLRDGSIVAKVGEAAQTPPETPNLQPDPTILPTIENGVPHLRDGSIVAKVGEAAQIPPETPNPTIEDRVPHLRDSSIVAKVGEAAQLPPETPKNHPVPTIENGVPHLRDGSIVAKVGEAAQTPPETPNLHPDPTLPTIPGTPYPDSENPSFSPSSTAGDTAPKPAATPHLSAGDDEGDARWRIDLLASPMLGLQSAARRIPAEPYD